MQSRDINLFKVNDVVSVPGIPEYANIRIDHISDTGVTVTGSKCGTKVNISGRTPAIMATDMPKTEQVEGEDGEERTRVRRGTYTEKMKNLKMPTELTFTAKQFAELNDIPINYALDWIKLNCEEVGYADRAEGQKGKSAKLYAL